MRQFLATFLASLLIIGSVAVANAQIASAETTMSAAFVTAEGAPTTVLYAKQQYRITASGSVDRPALLIERRYAGHVECPALMYLDDHAPLFEGLGNVALIDAGEYLVDPVTESGDPLNGLGARTWCGLLVDRDRYESGDEDTPTLAAARITYELRAGFDPARNCVLPGVRGRTVAWVRQRIRAAGCRTRTKLVQQRGTKVRPGHVVRVAPGGTGSRVIEKGTWVTIHVAAKPDVRVYYKTDFGLKIRPRAIAWGNMAQLHRIEYRSWGGPSATATATCSWGDYVPATGQSTGGHKRVNVRFHNRKRIAGKLRYTRMTLTNPATGKRTNCWMHR